MIGTGNIIFPCVSLFCGDQGELSIGDNNTFFSNSLIEAVSGPIVIGSINQFGEGGFSAKTNRPGASIVVGDNGRYLNGAAVFGETILGTGSQILGAITVDSCHLEAGQSYKDADPDLRAGLLKGSGVARDLTVAAGQVILGNGSFSLNDIKPQAFFHPKGK
ncbi:AraC family transcriptional regulator [Pannonibacter sp. SL95]|uniref:AraC family transcriptional regulator n=1 Tax=Pannonibacter sp. SL95 TaxID=2995153 RepID=UPI002274256C|nr:AraC family transcriptional regulator [Pannonibacter sp. SL95]MCY1707769.1 AraC family transcriptional regulator [Pannonibacter sp. SL95]